MLRLLSRLAALALLVSAASTVGAQATEKLAPTTVTAAESHAPSAMSSAAPDAAHQEAATDHAASGGHDDDMITPHITDSRYIEIPTFSPPFVHEVKLPRWAPIHIGGLELDLSPTKHVVMMLLAAFLVSALLILTARAQARQHASHGHAKGWTGGIEAMVLYIRNEVIIPNVGPHGNGYVPFLLTLFFFILAANVLGLIPYGSTATGNISVTATLAAITFVVVETAGMRAQGMGYLNTIFFWPHDMHIAMRIPMSIIISPIELVGKFARPIALAIRLFANMTAGHIVMLAFISLIFYFKSAASGAPFLMAIAISFLELFVAFLQAFVFTLLASVFIGQVREAHH